ncbi:MAG: ABC transporter ATP-binding protein [Dehalococcoidia bacterium]|nr:ABC transporter ATP-binding protein [Dehalococcoidia bacterium]
MAMAFNEEDELLGRVYDRALAARLLRYVRPYRRAVWIAVVLLLFIAGLELVGPLIIREAIDGQIAQGRTDRLAPLTAVFVGSLVLLSALRYSQELLMVYVGQRVLMDMRLELFTHLQRMSVSYFDRNPVGRLVTRLTNDTAAIEAVVSQGLVTIFTNLLMLVAIVGMMLVLDWQLALVMYALLPPLVIVVRYFAAKQRDLFREQRMWLARINAYLNETITGITVVQLFNRERENLRRFDERNRGHLSAHLRFLMWYAVFEPTVVLFGAVTTASIIWYGGGRVIDASLTIGTLVAFTAYMQRFYWPLREISQRYSGIQQAMASAERIFGILDEPEEIIDPAEPRHLTDVRGKIEFRDVWFAYVDENWVLRDVSMVVEPGESVAIVGATGAGKSTMTALLSRFYDVQRGQILVDDVPIDQLAQQELRLHVGIMLQDPFVYTDTIEENIRLRDRSISPERVRAAAELIGADGFIERLPDGYDTMLAERGANLSTGQKQLLALARVAAFNPEIVLVMDEATASIDPDTEAVIQRGIHEVMSERTSIVIAHRLNTIRAVDRIVVLEHGEVAEEGTHEQLLAREDGHYARLYELQYKGQDVAPA